MKNEFLSILFLTTIVASIQIGCGRSVQVNTTRDNPHRHITISVSPDDPTKCEVDYPVVVLRMKKKHTIVWTSADNQYYVKFDNNSIPVGNSNVISVSPGAGGTGDLSIAVSQPNYFQYAIYSSDPAQNPNSICKRSDDDRDTGLNVKP
jgi:hypothetical protein